MKKDLLRLGLLVITGLMFGIYMSTIIAPLVSAEEFHPPTCCQYGAENCFTEWLYDHPWVTPCYYSMGCVCSPAPWVDYARCVCY
jgi:hypothetical protein